MSDASTQSWSPVASLSTARRGCAAAAVGDTVYVFGGDDENRKDLSLVEAYDVETRSWSPIAPMSTARFGCAAAAVGDNIFVFGGYGGINRLSSAEAYNVRTRSWSSVASMSTARWGCAAAVVGDSIFVFGGWDGGKHLSSAEAYDVETRSWSSVAPMSTVRSSCAAAAVGDSIFVFGGWDGDKELSSAEAYNVRTRSWSSVASMSTNRCGCAAAAVGNTIFVFGGRDDGGKNLSSAEAYDVRTQSWSPVASMSTARNECAAAVAGDGIYAMGGVDGNGNRIASAEALRLPRSGMSPFYAALIAEDDRNINFKITELIPLLEDVHQVKFFYTMVNASYRMGQLDGDDRNRYAKAALERAAQTTTCTDSVTLFKLVLKKAHEDGAINEYTKKSLKREAEVKHTSCSPFVADIWKHMERLELRTSNLEARVEGLETHVDALHTSLVKLQKGIRRQQKVEAVVGIMGAVLNAVSFGLAGSAVSGVMSMTIGNIVDFGDLAHIQAVANAVGDATVSDALKEGLEVIEDLSDERLYAAAKEGKSILGSTAVRAQLTTAAEDGNPLAAVAVTAHVISVNYGALAQTLPGIGSGEDGGVLFPPPPEKKLNVADRVKRIEDELSLASVPSKVSKRVNNLEEEVFGESQEGTGSLFQRISSLEKELGLD